MVRKTAAPRLLRVFMYFVFKVCSGENAICQGELQGNIIETDTEHLLTASRLFPDLVSGGHPAITLPHPPFVSPCKKGIFISFRIVLFLLDIGFDPLEIVIAFLSVLILSLFTPGILGIHKTPIKYF